MHGSSSKLSRPTSGAFLRSTLKARSTGQNDSPHQTNGRTSRRRISVQAPSISPGNPRDWRPSPDAQANHSIQSFESTPCSETQILRLSIALTITSWKGDSPMHAGTRPSTLFRATQTRPPWHDRPPMRLRALSPVPIGPLPRDHRRLGPYRRADESRVARRYASTGCPEARAVRPTGSSREGA